MGRRGRPSRVEQSLVVHLGKRAPPEPPAELTEAQAAVWRSTLASLPAEWIEPAALPVLSELCRRVCRAQQLDEQIREFLPEWLRADGGLERFNQLLSMADREGRGVIACARSLRLTPSALMHPRTAARRVDGFLPVGERPWDE